jgi:hypothetical protein
VGVLDGPRQGPNQLGGLQGRLRLPAEAIRQGATFDQFQREERGPDMVADLEYLNNVRMLETGGGGRLGPETGQLIGPGVRGPEDDLQGDRSIEGDLPGPVDDTHPAATEFAEDFVSRRGEVGRGRARGPVADSVGRQSGRGVWGLEFNRRAVGGRGHADDYGGRTGPAEGRASRP